jgi:radical SAM protein with 4Fe4S-binding SPASM domain
MSFGLGPALVRRDGKPAAATVLLADRCNEACVHCYQVHGKGRELTLSELEALFAELASIGVLFLTLSGGEVTLRADLPQILRAARRHGFAISMITNGLKLTDELLDTIEEIGLWGVHVTVYSDRAEEHDAITRVRGSFERTCENIRRLCARGVRVELGMPLTSSCSASRERLQAFAAEMGCNTLISPWMTAREDGSLAPFEVAATPSQLRDFFEHASAPRSELTREAMLDAHPCGACSAPSVAADGSVHPCSEVSQVLASALQPESLRALADSEPYRVFAGVRWRDLHGCRDCALMPWCSRCHGSARKERGDLFGPQPEACRVAIARYEAQVRPLVRLPEGPKVLPRAAGSGPFALRNDGHLEPIADVMTEGDQLLRARFPWITDGKSGIAERLVPADRLVRGAAASPPVAGQPVQS